MVSRLFKSLVLLMAGAALVNCSASSGGDTASTASTWALSGTMSGLSYMSVEPQMSMAEYAKNEAVTALATMSAQKPISKQGTGEGENSAMAACTDGKYYRVLCSAWSTPPVSAYGDVSCSGASGSFTVSGLPLNTDITCAVRRSSDNSSFVPFATLELPASSTTSGTSDSIVASGNMALAISVSSTGSITTTVTSGSSNNKGTQTVGSGTADLTTMTGFYNLSCDATSDSTNNTKCKCFIGGSNSESKETCVSNGAVNVTVPGSGVIQTVNLAVYKALVQTGGVDFNGDSTIDLTAGSTVFGGTVWGASNGGNSCTSAGSCNSSRGASGEAFPTFSGQLAWTGTTSTAAIAFATSVSASTTCGTNATVTIPAVPTSSGPRYSNTDNGTDGTISSWQDWLRTVEKNYVTAFNTACGADPSVWNGCGVAIGSVHNDPSCTGNFIWNVYKNWTNANLLPRLDWEWSCGNTGCPTTFGTTGVGNLSVKGIEFNGTTGVATKYQPEPEARYVMDQFIPNSAGTGGSLKSKNDNKRMYYCNAISGTPTIGAACPGGAAGQATQGFECGVGEEMTIKFLPSSTTGIFNLVFSQTQFVRYGTFRGPNGNTYSLDGTNAFSQCVAVTGNSTTVPSFLAKATKL